MLSGGWTSMLALAPVSSLVCRVTSAPVEILALHGPANGFDHEIPAVHPSVDLHVSPQKPAATTTKAEASDLGVGEYRVGRRINRVLRDLRYTIEEVIPTRSGKTILVIDPAGSELFSGYNESSFPDEPVGFIPLVGPIQSVTFKGRDVSDQVILGAREMLFQIIPSHGGRV